MLAMTRYAGLLLFFPSQKGEHRYSWIRSVEFFSISWCELIIHLNLQTAMSSLLVTGLRTVEQVAADVAKRMKRESREVERMSSKVIYICRLNIWLKKSRCLSVKPVGTTNNPPDVFKPINFSCF
ncbi:uncharacterized protein MYCFIDRAFT_169505 [Pseudocercospora fijiensis CIRAD86]|uniref:Uncharacterized protein n=1 Tax=Pseudocercospora fijiensis (strain CIRAD86) TaxID=383855 RepID=N1QA21_PSEFD|nr:uncharacterized protein MYCFIDRAFT_169505 [Pseudocercospora fijiensis CIRAD86]EME87743.1 hypothetical protein MYCFIDRAFT_169505 [Pseudocercospora fijiensis CIRAD86]